jgi:hypothetical protein
LKNSYSPEENEKLNLVHFFTQKHANAVVFNYNQGENWAGKFILSRSHRQVRMNNVYVCESTQYLFWVETRLEEFGRFWDYSHPKYIDKIISTNEQVLFDFQKFIFEQSGYQFTIIDLQGAVDQEGNYILSDVEFTTSYLYEFTPNMLIEEFARLNNLERVNLHDLNKKMRSLNERMAHLEEEFSELKKDINEKFDFLMQAISELKK